MGKRAKAKKDNLPKPQNGRTKPPSGLQSASLPKSKNAGKKARAAQRGAPHGAHGADHVKEGVGAADLGGETAEEEEEASVGTDEVDDEDKAAPRRHHVRMAYAD